jgi:two-component system NtrC family sensor kinase
MAAMVAHEFNNILTPVVSYAELAQRNPRLTAKAIAKAADGGKRATAICDAILHMTHGRAPEAVETPLADLVAETLTVMGRDPAKDRIDLRVDAPGGQTATVPRVELQQALLNLILNARQAVLDRRPPRRIEISARRHDGRVVLRVRDNGAGIAPEDRQHIFEPFYTTRAGGREGGSGLGLAICQQIVQAANGSIHVTSTPGKGSTFIISLPAEPTAGA